MLAGVALTPFAAALATKTVAALAVDGRQLSDAGPAMSEPGWASVVRGISRQTRAADRVLRRSLGDPARGVFSHSLVCIETISLGMRHSKCFDTTQVDTDPLEVRALGPVVN